MIKIRFRKVLPGKEERLKSWFAELTKRKDEVIATFIDETVYHEMAYFVKNGDETILVYAMELKSIDASQKAFVESKHQIDFEHRAIMKECLGERLEIDPLFDIKRE